MPATPLASLRPGEGAAATPAEAHARREAADRALKGGTAPAWRLQSSLGFGVFYCVAMVVVFLLVTLEGRAIDDHRSIYANLQLPPSGVVVMGQADDAVKPLDIFNLFGMPTPTPAVEGATVEVTVPVHNVPEQTTYVTSNPGSANSAATDRVLTATTAGATITVGLGTDAIAPVRGQAIAYTTGGNVFTTRGLDERALQSVGSFFSGDGSASSKLTINPTGATAGQRMVYDGTKWVPGTATASGFATSGPIFKGTGTVADPVNFDFSTARAGDTMTYLGGGRWGWQPRQTLAGKASTSVSCSTNNAIAQTMSRTEAGGRFFVRTGSTSTAAPGSSLSPCLAVEPHVHVVNFGRTLRHTDGIAPTPPQAGQQTVSGGAESVRSFDANLMVFSASASGPLLSEHTPGTNNGTTSIVHVGLHGASSANMFASASDFQFYRQCAARTTMRAAITFCDGCTAHYTRTSGSPMRTVASCGVTAANSRSQGWWQTSHVSDMHGRGYGGSVYSYYGALTLTDVSSALHRPQAQWAYGTGVHQPASLQGLVQWSSDQPGNLYANSAYAAGAYHPNRGHAAVGVAVYASGPAASNAPIMKNAGFVSGMVVAYDTSASFGTDPLLGPLVHNVKLRTELVLGLTVATQQAVQRSTLRVQASGGEGHAFYMSGSMAFNGDTSDMAYRGSCSSTMCEEFSPHCTGCRYEFADGVAHPSSTARTLESHFYYGNATNFDVGEADNCCNDASAAMGIFGGHSYNYYTVMPGYTGTLELTGNDEKDYASYIGNFIDGAKATSVIAYPSLASTRIRNTFSTKGTGDVVHSYSGSP